MQLARIVTVFDELGRGQASRSLDLEVAPVDQLAFERGRKALAYGVFIRLAHWFYGWPVTGFLAS
jgi:hypothetical protein